MKILYVINRSTDGGLVSTTRSRIHAFKKRGVLAEVAFLSRGDGANMFKEITHYYIESIKHFQQIIVQGYYDCIIFVYSLDYRKYVPDDYKGKIIYELRGWSPGVVKQLQKKNINKSVDGVVCIANYIKPLVKKYFSDSIPIFIDGNTVNPIFRYVPLSKRSWAPLSKINIRDPVIAFVGRVENQKNWREFIEICNKVTKQIPIEVWIITNPKTSNSFHQMLPRCSDYRLKARVFHVFNDQMPDVYSSIADSGGCVLSTSIREGLGNSILEPMACLCPVVSSDKPGKNEIIFHGHNGMLYPLGSIEEAANLVEKVIKDSQLRKGLIQNARATIKDRYNQNLYVERYIDIIEEI